MLVDWNGPDLLRVQRSTSSRIADPLDPDVIVSGAFDDGQALFFQQAVSAPGVSQVAYTIGFGRTLAAPPVVIGGLKLSQALVQRDTANSKNVQYFDPGEIVAPCIFKYNKGGGAGTIINWNFSFYVYADRIELTVGGFVGTAEFLVLDV
ncbi:hypothetical protein [Methylobacterium brachythecii]|uniref:Uncharacterized protein n=1 Tax=Methylobacterium brachythecii TaxID=1176177 RepID=A0A7W6AP73_9HYPH|nr:hypothetical protein [Methylobacterium brachythecii]MBB3904171.1 hypothetical protein [Methylobacterium brachythecii]GLS45167.1 hypothetical protein GCM10007884_31560 [Methylobacterium brachythecii]